MSWFKLGKKDKPDSPSASESEPLPSTEPGLGGETPTAGAQAPESAVAGELEPRKIPEALADLFLVMAEHLNPVELEEIEALVSNLQQPPPLVERLTGGLDDPEDLREAILSSPTLSADVLRVVNSAAFALNSPISSIEHAVTYLGTTMVKGLVMQSAVTQVMRFETDVQKAAYMRIWRASYVASAAAQVYALKLGLEHPSIYATRALLVNVGDLALISGRPELAIIYANKTDLLTRVDAQQQEFMANSAVLSSLLASHWKLPSDLCDALRHSLTPLAWAPDSGERSDAQQREDALLYLACRVGDAVAYKGLKDIGDFDVLAQESADFYYLPEYLRRAELGELVRVFDDRKLGRRVQQIMDTFG